MPTPPSSPPRPPGMPPGVGAVYRFAVVNALSYQIVLGSPMVLYAKSLGASATVLGILAGMMPLLVIFQIPAARHIARVGYRRFVFAGWSVRVSFIFMIALVPLTGRFLNPANRIALLLFLLFGFNLSRGISTAAWLPWITALVPADIRGKYLARESACVNAGSCLTVLLAGAALGSQPGAWQFAAIFAFSAIMGVASLSYLQRIPDAENPGSEHPNPNPIPWAEIAAYPPFRKLLWLNVAWSVGFGGLTAFTVAYLKTAAALPEGRILLMTAGAYLGGLGALGLFGTRLDRHGSRPALLAALLGWLGILAVWVLLAGGVVAARAWVIVGLQLAMGLAYAVFAMANTRLAMATVPPLGRDHFFALFSVVGNLTLGVAPVAWGLLIDALGPGELGVLGFRLNGFSVFFLLVWLVFALSVALCRRLEEPRAANLEALLRDLLGQTPWRTWVRLWPRG